MNHININYVNQLSGRQFEFFTAHLLKILQYTQVQVTPKGKDFGLDVIAKLKNGTSFGIQCKHSKNNIGYHAIEEALCGKAFYHLNTVAVLTNSTYTKQAIKGARQVHILLWNKSTLRALIDVANNILYDSRINYSITLGKHPSIHTQFKQKLRELSLINSKHHSKSAFVCEFILSHINRKTDKLKMTDNQIRHYIQQSYSSTHITITNITINRVITGLEHTIINKNGYPLLVRKRYGQFGKKSYIMINPVALIGISEHHRIKLMESFIQLIKHKKRASRKYYRELSS